MLKINRFSFALLLGACISLFAKDHPQIDPVSSLIFAPQGIGSSTPVIMGILKKNNGKAVKNRKVKVFIDGKAYAVVTSDNNGVFVYQVRPDIGLTDGVHYTYAVDCVHNSYIRGRDFVVDTTKKKEMFRSGNVSQTNSNILFPGEGFYVGQDTFSIVCGLYDSGNQAVDAETMTLRTDSTIVSSTTQSNQYGVAVYSLTAGQALSEGSHTCDAYAQESDVNLTQTNFVVDLTPPLPPVFTSPTDQEVITTSDILVEGTCEADASVTVFLDEDTYGEITYADSNGDWSVELYDLADGEHSIFGIQTDLAFLESDPSDPVTFTIST